MVTLLLIIIYLAFIGLGLPDALLGSAWSIMKHDIHGTADSSCSVRCDVCGYRAG
ncbi:hypothetical protein [Paenibacillus sp. PCH8]|uniref:hypothetical protein n=1 Tax=Paenibacillus sp. PCH8 TaxID=2066524 RepID=UPI0015E3150B|nr:hypothetical protein [Paenibacillus sp. PCH8]